MKGRTKKAVAGVSTFFLAALLAASLGVSVWTSTSTASAGTLGGKYYPDYSSLDEALEAAGDLNLEVAEEGNVLLKNDGTLPLTGKEYVSVFGISSAALVGASGNTNSVGNADGVSDRGPIYDSLVDAGFKVNTILADYYSTLGGAENIGNEVTDFSSSVSSSFRLYDDVGVVVLSRNAGEGADADMVIDEVEDNDYLGEDQGWEHDALFRGTYSSTVADCAYDESGSEYKHYLQLTESEEDLIEYVEANFEKVVVVLNTANAMEMYNLKEDENINGILLMGRPGETGHTSVGEILSGAVNPSGRLVDEWNTDFSADPTWQNFGWGYQVGSQNMYYFPDGEGGFAGKNGNEWGTHQQDGYYGVDYEEDIYLGYAYWETAYYEYYESLIAGGTEEAKAIEEANAWYEQEVAFPFGYGLSYTSFSMNIDEDAIYATGNSGKVSGFSFDENLETLFASDVGDPADVKTLYIPVDVTNTGNVAGKEVVEVYVTAPYSETSNLEKSFVTLSGYAKSDVIRAGATETVWVKVNVQDFSSFDYNDKNGNNNLGYELDIGEYTIRAMSTSHYDLATDTSDTTDEYDEVSFTLDTTVNLVLDDFSDNVATALFSDEIDEYQVSEDGSHYLPNNSLRTADYSYDGESEEVLLTRSDWDNTQPAAPTEGDLQMTEDVYNNWEYWNEFDTDDQEGDPWYVGSIATNWTQGTGVLDSDGHYGTLLADMMGIELYDSSTESGFSAEWDEFMNQLTVDEMKTLVERQQSMWTTTEMESIGKISSTQADSYNDVRTSGGLFLWTDSPTLAATWNTEIAERVGLLRGNLEVLSGWSGYGGKEMDTHRSPFSGRNAEYLSQDGIQGGYMAAAFTSGMESKGVTCYIKHFALNDQETCRDGMNNNSWVSEQAARQIYFKVFQMAMQEGGSSAAMTGFARFCGLPISMNYGVCNQMVCGEWGWEGFYITDGYSGVSTCTTMESMMRSYVIPLPLGSSVPNIQGDWDETEREGMGAITIDGEVNNTQYYYLRATAARILYADAKSNDVLNGFVTASLADNVDSTTITVTQGSSVSVDLGFSDEYLDGSTVVYESSGTLPSGLSITDGVLSGTPTEAGTYTFTLTATIDGWVTSDNASGLSQTYTLVVESAIYIDETDSDNPYEATVGDEIYIVFNASALNTGDSISYSIDVDLSAYGLSLDADEGVISGTATASGTIEYTLSVGIGTTTSDSSGTSTTYTYYTYAGTLTITGTATDDTDTDDTETTVVTVSAISVDDSGNLVVSYTDGTSATLSVASTDVTITSVAQDSDGDLVITYSDGSSSTITISSGSSETTIKDITVNDDGDIVVTYTDGTTATLTVAEASGCGSTIALSAAGIAVLVILAAAAVVIVARKRTSVK